MDFIIPVHTEDLEAPKKTFYVRAVLDPEASDPCDVLDEVSDRLLNGDVFRAAVDNAVFDPLYSIVKAWSVLNSDSKAKLVEVMTSAAQEMIVAVREVTAARASVTEAIPQPRAEMASLRNGFKAAMYLFAIFIQVAEKNTKDAAIAGAGGAKGGKKGKAGKQPASKRGKKPGPVVEAADGEADEGDNAEAPPEPGEDAEGAFDWPAYRTALVLLLSDALALDLRCLWPHGLPEEDFVGVFLDTGFRLLASAAGMRDKELRRAVTGLVAGGVARFPATMAGVAARLVAATTMHEHIGPIAADVVQAWSGGAAASACPAAAAEVLLELGRMSAGGDAATLRRAAAFVTDVSDRLPRLVLTNVSVLLPFLECDAYAMRSAIAAVIANIVARALGPGEPHGSAGGAVGAGGALVLSDATRADLLGMLHARAYDVHSLTRAAALKAWISLARHAAVPADDLAGIAELAVDRLRDKAASVRRAAAQLLRALVEHNPFGPHASAAVYAEQAAAAAQWLAEHAPGLDASRGGVTAAKSTTAPSEDGSAAAAAAMLDDAEAAESDAAIAMGAAAPGSVHVTPEVAEQLQLRAQALSGRDFSLAVQAAVPAFEQLLGSKTGTDVMEAIRFLSRARAFAIPGADAGLAQMLTLVWSQEGSVKEEVIETFHKLYLLNETLDDDDGGAARFGGAADDDNGDEAPAPAPAAAEAAPPPAPHRKAPRKAASKKPARAAASAAHDEEEDGGAAEDDDGVDDEEAEADDVDEDDGDEPAAGPARAAGKARGGAAAGRAKKLPSAAAPRRGKKTAAARRAEAAGANDVDPLVAADNLIGILQGASLAVVTSAEEVLGEVARRGWLPQSVLDCLWEAVAAGSATLQQGRVHAAVCVAAAVQEARSSAPGARAAARSALAVAATARPDVHAALSRARGALAILGMISGALPSAGAPTSARAASDEGALLAARLRCVVAVLCPPKLPAGTPSGCALLIAAANAAGTAVNDPLVAGLDLCGGTAGDYRLARHACVALSRLVSCTSSAAAAPASSSSGAAAAPAFSAAPPAKGAKAAKGKGLAAAAAAPAAAEASGPGPCAGLVADAIAGLCGMIRGDWDGGDVESAHWYAAAQSALDALFAVVPEPGAVCLALVRGMTASALQQQRAGPVPSAGGICINRTRLARLFFVTGHVAMKTFLYLEALVTLAKSSRAKASGGAAGAAPKPGGEGGIEEQLGGGATEVDGETELVARIADSELVSSTRSICGVVAPLISAVVTGALLQPQVGGAASAPAGKAAPAMDSLAQSALLALCKLMAVSADFCGRHLQLLLTVVGAPGSGSSLRSTIAIALGDLAFRFPNAVEPYTHLLYARLRDADVGVRKTTLMVLTHLVLNDMIKAKGHIGEIAVCLHDSDPRIVDLARLFFTELSKRGGNPIYNLLPDALSCLSRIASESSAAAAAAARVPPPTSAAAPPPALAFDQAAFRSVVKFLLSFINKDKHADALAEKLLRRLAGGSAGGAGDAASAEPHGSVAASEERALWRDVAFCLCQLPLNEKVVRKLAEGLRLYQRCLGDDDVWESISGIAAKARRSAGGAGSAAAAAAGAGASKADMRALVDEWERALGEARAAQVEDDFVAGKATAAAQRATLIVKADGADPTASVSEAIAEAAALRAAAAAAAGPPKRGGGGGRKAPSKPRAAGADAASASAAPKSRAPRKKAAKRAVADDDDDDNAGGMSGEEDGAAPVAAAGKSAPAPARRQVKRVVSSDEDDDGGGEGAASGTEGGAGAPAKQAAAAPRGGSSKGRVLHEAPVASNAGKRR